MITIANAWRGMAVACVLLTACAPPREPVDSTPVSKEPSAPPSTPEAPASTETTQHEEPATTEAAEAELFSGWGTPQVAFLLTGQQIGYIEPCGCAGLTNQKGGLARRHTLARQLTERGWPLVALDAGNQVRRFGKQAETKFQVAINALKHIGYQAIALGESDLRLSAGVLASVTMATETEASPFVCANAAVFARDITPQYQIIESGGKKIGVTAILGTEQQKSITSSEIVLVSPEAGLAAVMPKLKEADCDLLVLLAHAEVEESKGLAQQFSDFDIVVTTGGPPEPSYQPELIEGTEAILVRTGTKAMFAVVVGVFDDDRQPLRYQRVPIDARYEDSGDMLQTLASYQDQLKDSGLDGLEIDPILHSSGSRFVGSQHCQECHEEAFEIWEATPHATAIDSLVNPNERSEIARHFDPECLSCHVTGWHPQRYFPYEGGYLGLETTPQLVGNGCENCHGPGSSHVAAELGDLDVSTDRLEELREAMRLPLEKAERKCQECHDIDNDPDFVKNENAFDEHWPDIEH